ncbi:conserved hypothetical protein [Hymenobacter roseosalivarius DSM 11622]|uniref:Uncharacterized protein n=1 Tax=Hymenobacter roseosalivarius DSM 11622 TaxID=645990 RepID=A0A1W1V377_9BACT|nr:periplasmic heavy metal sensor [Hymenobacter roseosalivarius]SMB87736.1 conserved hypothetical protein [Hymenobacter roseosalivarius DSM 11622]
MNRSFWLLRGLKFFFLAALFVAAAGFVTMRLWNWLVPVLFKGPFISFWQTLALLVLTRILFGGWGRGGRPGGWARRREVWRKKMESRMAHLTPEEQKKFRQQMRSSCGPPWMRRSVEEETASTSA